MLKICFNNQTHLLTRHPSSLKELLTKVHQLFSHELPARWFLQYHDSDQDLITVKDESEYQELLHELPKLDKAVKVFVVSDNTKVQTSTVMPKSFKPIDKSSFVVLDNPEISKNHSRKPSGPLQSSISKFSRVLAEPKVSQSGLKSHQEKKEEGVKLMFGDPPMRKESQNIKESWILQNQNSQQEAWTSQKIQEQNQKEENKFNFDDQPKPKKELEKPLQVSLQSRNQDPQEYLKSLIFANKLRKDTLEDNLQHDEPWKNQNFEASWQHQQSQIQSSAVNSELRRPMVKPAVEESELTDSRISSEVNEILSRREQIESDKRISEEEEFEKMFLKMMKKYLPVFVEQIQEKIQEQQGLENPNIISFIHEVQCNGCKKFPIVGTRYQCLVCPDFNFCEQCEENHDHMHPFAKLKKNRDQEFIKPQHQVQVPKMLSSSIAYQPNNHLEKSLKLEKSYIPEIEHVQSIVLDDHEKPEKMKDLGVSIQTPRGFMDESLKFPGKISHIKPMEKSFKMKESRRIADPEGLLESFKESVRAQGLDLKEKGGKKDLEGVPLEIRQKALTLQEFFGGEMERILSFVKRNSKLEMEVLGEQYLNYISSA